MAADWFLARGGQQRVGPLTAQQLKQMAAAGQVTGNDLVWKEGMAQWVAASQVKGLLGGSSGSQVLQPDAVATVPAPAAVPMEASEPAPMAIEEDAGVRVTRDGEPWFYGFLEKFATIFMWLGLGLVLMFFLYFLVIVAIPALSASPFAGLLMLVMIFLGAGSYALVIVLWTAMMLLVVDMGRSLRSINRKVDKSEQQ
jgi:hypothetical protein